MANPHVLAIDLGTSGPKVALVGLDGSVAASRAGSIGLTVDGDRAEHDPAEIWRAVADATRAVVADAGEAARSIAAVTCTSQYFSLVPIDRDGNALGPMLSWMDRRGARWNLDIYERHPEAFELWAEVHGMVPLPTGVDSLGHLLWFRHEQPAIYEAAHCFVEPMDFVLARLCADFAANPCTAFAQLLTDNRDPTRPRYDDRLLAMAGVDVEKLPPLVAVNARLGTLRPQVACELGLPAATPVFAGINDTQAASIATATFRDGTGAINVGTTGQVLAHVPDKRADFDNEILSMPSPVAGRHLAMAENGLGAKPLDFFLRSIVFANDVVADHGRADAFATLEDTVRSVPAGAGNLLFLPWLRGSGSPVSSTSARGGFLNVSLETTRAEMVRAVLEGCAFNLRWLLPAVERFAGSEFAVLGFSGGAAVSAEWSRIVADVMQRPVRQLADARHANNRATALLAFRELGLCDLDAVDRLCPVREVHEPRRGNAALYDHLFAQYLAIFEALRPVFSALNRD
jgi:xylulokinase